MVGVYGDESLPNITGILGFGGNVARTGAFGVEPTNVYGSYGGGDTSGANYFTNFNAYRSSSTYQDGAKVNPDNLQVQYIIKY